MRLHICSSAQHTNKRAPTAMATTTSSKRVKWSLHIDISNAHKSTCVVDASCLRHCQPRPAMSLASIAEDAIRHNRGTCTSWSTRVQFSPCPGDEAEPNVTDKELQQVLHEVKNTQQDELQFQAWKRSIESQHPCLMSSWSVRWLWMCNVPSSGSVTPFTMLIWWRKRLEGNDVHGAWICVTEMCLRQTIFHFEFPHSKWSIRNCWCTKVHSSWTAV